MLLRTSVAGLRTSAPRRGGFVIIAVLMVVTVLTLAAYQYSALMDAEVLATERIRRTTESKVLADSGLHVAMALLADPDAMSGVLNNNPYDNPAQFQSILVRDSGAARSRGRFTVVSLDLSQDAAAGSVPLRYGVTDEGGKININALMTLDSSGRVLHDALMKLPNMTDSLAWSIVDWVDPDDTANPGGAESADYTGAYQCKNAPLDTVEELLLVKGVTPSLLFGTDRNRNGKLDADEDDGSGFNPGWAAYLTVYSRERNVDAEGNPRLNLNGNDLKKLKEDLTNAIGPDAASLICAYRLFGTSNMGGAQGAINISTPGAASLAQLQQAVDRAIQQGTQPRQRVSSIMSLVNARMSITIPASTPRGKDQQVTITSPLNSDPGLQREWLPKLFDKTTTQQGTELPARINVNTAPREVLRALPSLEEADVDAIVARRPTFSNGDGADEEFSSIAWLLSTSTLTLPKLQSIERYVTTRTQVYRVQSIGYFDEAGPVSRIEAVIDTNQGKPRVIYYRDLTELGRALDPRASR